MTYPLYDRLRRLHRGLSEAGHQANLVHGELGSGKATEALSVLLPLIAHIDNAAQECRAIVESLRDQKASD